MIEPQSADKDIKIKELIIDTLNDPNNNYYNLNLLNEDKPQVEIKSLKEKLYNKIIEDKNIVKQIKNIFKHHKDNDEQIYKIIDYLVYLYFNIIFLLRNGVLYVIA